MFRFLSQFFLASSITGMVPVDAVQMEQMVDQTQPSYFLELPQSRARHLYGSLPVAESRFTPPIKKDVDSYGVVTTARSALVVDRDSGEVLFAKEPDQVRSIGSVTKLMTVMVFLDTAPNLDQLVSLQSSTDLVYGGRIYLNFGDSIMLRDVLAASLVGSDNSATQSLVRFSGLTQEEFVLRMNEKAEEIGLEQSVFVDATGLSSKNISTARELVQILSFAERYDAIRAFTSLPEVTVTQSSGVAIPIQNTNGLLSTYLHEGDYRVEGGKTGYLPEAGYVLVSLVREGNHGVYVVVMGSDSLATRVSDAKSLAGWAFKTYDWGSL